MQPVANISVYNRAVTPLGFDLNVFTKAMQRYVDHFLLDVWGTPAVLTVTDGPVNNTWGFVFMDDADQPGALAYHTVSDGLPLAKIFVRTTLDDDQSVSVSASHELVEMLVDPSCAYTVTNPANGEIYAYEAADPVEESWFNVQGFDMSNFVYPRYFKAQESGIHQYDWLHALTAPFTLMSGGYQSVFVNGQWTEIFGSIEKEQRFAKEDRRGHRSEYRKGAGYF